MSSVFTLIHQRQAKEIRRQLLSVVIPNDEPGKIAFVKDSLPIVFTNLDK